MCFLESKYIFLILRANLGFKNKSRGVITVNWNKHVFLFLSTSYS